MRMVIASPQLAERDIPLPIIPVGLVLRACVANEMVTPTEPGGGGHFA